MRANLGNTGFATLATVAAIALSAPVMAQDIISARAGLVHYVVGEVSLRDAPAKVEKGAFPQVGNGEILRTGDGLAEVLLSPGTLLRLAPNSAFRMISDAHTETEVEVVEGEMLLEIDAIYDENTTRVLVGEARVEPFKRGLYYFKAEDGVVRVFDGKAMARLAGTSVELKKGRFVKLAPGMKAAKFSTKEQKTSLLYRWSQGRANVLASGTQITLQQGYDPRLNTWASYGNGSGWFWSSALNSFVLIPYRGSLQSPFGYYFYSPSAWASLLAWNAQGWNNSGGGNNASSGWAGMASAPRGGSSDSGYAPVRSSAPAQAAPSGGGGESASPAAADPGRGRGR